MAGGSAGWTSSHAPEGIGFDLCWVCMGGSQLMFPSLSFSSSLTEIGKNISSDKNLKN